MGKKPRGSHPPSAMCGVLLPSPRRRRPGVVRGRRAVRARLADETGSRRALGPRARRVAKNVPPVRPYAMIAFLRGSGTRLHPSTSVASMRFEWTLGRLRRATSGPRTERRGSLHASPTPLTRRSWPGAADGRVEAGDGAALFHGGQTPSWTAAAWDSKPERAGRL